MPWSRTAMTTQLPSRRRPTSMSVAAFEYFTALSSRLLSDWAMRAAVERDAAERLLRTVEDDAEAALAQADVERLERLRDHLLDVGALEAVALAPRLDAREVEDVVDELGEPPALGLDVVAVLPRLLRASTRPRRRYSPKTRIEASGVRSSCETFETKSLFICDSFICARGGRRASDDAAEERRRQGQGEEEIEHEAPPRHLRRRGVAAGEADPPVGEDEGESLVDLAAPFRPRLAR